MNTPTPVGALYARIQSHKAIWAVTSPHSEAFDRILDSAPARDAGIIESRSRSLTDVMLKLTEVLEIVREDSSETAIGLLGSAILDLDGFLGGDGAALPVPRPPAPAPVADSAAAQIAEIQRSKCIACGRKGLKKVCKGCGFVADASGLSKRKRRARPAQPTALTGIGPITVSRSCTPVTIDGTLYTSMKSASSATGLPYAKIRALAQDA